MKKYDKKKAIAAILEYIYFIENNRDKKGELSPKDPEKFDARRRQLHLDVAKTFGLSENSHPDYRNVIIFTGLEGFVWDKWVNDGRKVEDYAEILYWGFVDSLNKHNAPYTAVETSYRTKLRVDDIIKWTKEKIEKRMKVIDEVMDEYKRNQKAWNDDHEDNYIYDHSNRHDYNGLTGSIKSNIRDMELFAKQPMEAYLQVAVAKYVDAPLESINRSIEKLDGIAFRAQTRYREEPFYKYLEKKHEKEDK